MRPTLEQLQTAPPGTVFTERRYAPLAPELRAQLGRGGQLRTELRSAGDVPTRLERFLAEQAEWDARIAALEREPWAKG